MQTQTAGRQVPIQVTSEPEFYMHPMIQKIAALPGWTFSTPNEKKPIDARWLKSHHEIRGAYEHTSNCLMTLYETLELIGSSKAPNHAFWLDALDPDTDLIVLDIEPECPDDIKAKLMDSPYIYGEYSMSGKGVHLFYKTPDCLKDYPDAMTKIAMKEGKYYEFLLQHYVTFTKNMLPPSACTDKDCFAMQKFRELAANQKASVKIDMDKENVVWTPANIPMSEDILRLLSTNTFTRTPNDYDSDISRYEYAYLSHLENKLKNILNTEKIKTNGYAYTQADRAALMFTAAQSLIEYRTKHDTLRHGLPWLLDESLTIVLSHDAAKDQALKNSKGE